MATSNNMSPCRITQDSDFEMSSVDNDDVEPEQVTEDWALNVLLLDIARNTTDEEFEDMKFLCRGKNGFQKSTLEKITSPKKLFEILESRGHLDSNNLHFLQGIIWQAGNKINHQKIVAYAKKQQATPIHFFKPSEKPENGYTNVEFHVDGKETDRRNIQKIISTVADLLQIPRKDVLWKGLVPFNSIIVTLMIPGRALVGLLDLTLEERGYLLELNIDKFTTDDGTQIYLKGYGYKAPPVICESHEVDRLLRKEKELEHRIENMELALLSKRERCSTVDKRTTTLEARNTELQEKLVVETDKVHVFEHCYNQALITLAVLVNLILSDQSYQTDTVSREQSLNYIKHCLQKVRQVLPDKIDLIQEIVDAVSLNAFLSEREFWRKQIECMKIQTTFMKKQNATLLSLVERKPSLSGPLQATFKLRQQIILPLTVTADIEQKIFVRGALQYSQLEPGPYDLVLHNISLKLTEQQKLQLKEHAKFTPMEDNLAAIEPYMFLHILLSKDAVTDEKSKDFKRRVFDKIGILGDTDLTNQIRQMFQNAETHVPVNGIHDEKQKRRKQRNLHVSTKKTPNKGHKVKRY